MARTRGWKVLVLEKHYRIGGFTHTFSRPKGFEFDTGTHYIGELQKEGDLRTLLDYLTRGELQWAPLPHEFEEIIIPNFHWKIPGSRAEHLRRLIDEFPKEKQSLELYFDEETKVAEAYSTWQLAEQSSKLIAAFIRGSLYLRRKALFETTENALNRRFHDPRLKAILSARWMGYGVPPQQSSFGMHCLHSFHYGEGAWFPVGGGQMISDSLAETIRAVGGEVKTRAAVAEIIVQDNCAQGVRYRGPEDLESKLVRSARIISGVGAINTYLNLLKNFETSISKKVQETPAGESVLSLFLQLKESPRRHGFDAVNYWLIPDSSPRVADKESILSKDFTSFLSFPSLKRNSTAHTAQLIVMARNSLFEGLERESSAYRELKESLATAMIAVIESHFPNFTELVETAELSTPRTVERFVSTPSGAVYGLPTSPDRFFQPWAQSRTPIRNLYLTGTDPQCQDRCRPENLNS